MALNKKLKLKTFLVDNIECLRYDGGSGEGLNLPEFELYARDYLEFAEQELANLSTCGLINCVSNIKRAMDCQLDTFLSVFNLYKPFKDNNLKIEKKLEFLQEAGVFNSRSLSRLNNIRNKMEHEYEIPKVQDIELYYDLVVAFVAVLERNILILSMHKDMVFMCYDEDDKEIGNFCIGYKYENPLIEISWEKEKESEKLEVDVSNPYEFAYFLRVYFLMWQLETFASNRFVVSQL
ncbi:MAG: hypothetical protein P4L59_13300 [Desulfosporosinus sp.]|nr:hypothetical protein [Desulfosporosinus sp.]